MKFSQNENFEILSNAPHIHCINKKVKCETLSEQILRKNLASSVQASTVGNKHVTKEVLKSQAYLSCLLERKGYVDVRPRYLFALSGL